MVFVSKRLNASDAIFKVDFYILKVETKKNFLGIFKELKHELKSVRKRTVSSVGFTKKCTNAPFTEILWNKKSLMRLTNLRHG